MRRRFIIAFVVLFAVFAVGIGTSIYLLGKSSTELQSVLEGHQVEDLRQRLSLRLHTSQQDLQVSGTMFANQLDDIIGNVQALDDSAQGCFDCHHSPERTEQLERIASLLARYKTEFSTFITAYLNPERRKELQLVADTTAVEIDSLIHEMLLSATPALLARTSRAQEEVDNSWRILAITLVLTFAVAIGVALALARSVVHPVKTLVAATERIAAGELGQQIAHQEKHEIGALLDSFNEMSRTLRTDQEQINGYVGRLRELIQAVFSLHATPDGEALRTRLGTAMERLIDAEIYGSILKAEVEDVFVITLRRVGETGALGHAAISGSELQKLHAGASGQPLCLGEHEDAEWPFDACKLENPPTNFLISWIALDEELRGALIVCNKRGGDFVQEDQELLAALGSGVAEAAENVRLYRELRWEVDQIEKA